MLQSDGFLLVPEGLAIALRMLSLKITNLFQ